MRRLLVFLCFGTSIFAQALGNAGTIEGTVTDSSGAALPSAKVTILNRITDYEQTATTDSTGAFRLTNIPQNTYHVEASAPNFACLLYTSPSPRDRQKSRMPSS